MPRITHLTAVFFALSGLIGCDDPSLWGDLQDVANAEAAESTGVALSDIESAQYVREEEKLARDVYLQLYDAWGQNTHVNIASSEQTHTDQMAALLAQWGAVDPALDMPIGEFRDPELQQLHDDLMAMGLESAEAALRVGALIEEVDIIDLDVKMAEAQSQTLIDIYANLRAGSENHLRAFVGALEGQGVAYEPVQLDPAVYQAIVGAEGNGGGNGGNGGNGRR